MKEKVHLVLLAGALFLGGRAEARAQTAPADAVTQTNKTAATAQSQAATPPPDTSTTPADTDPTPTLSTTPDRDGLLITSDQVEELLKTDFTSPRPSRPEYLKLSPEIKRKLIEFQTLRERYLQEQLRLIKEFKGATDLERERIRENIQIKRERWLEQSRSFKEAARERLRDLMRELPKHREALDAAREAVREDASEIRKRSGQD